MQKSLHFIGICGSGMSSLALMYAQAGYKVSGCDAQTDSATAQQLEAAGCIVARAHASACCFDEAVVTYVYTTAVPADLPELIQARQAGKTVLHRAQALASLFNTVPHAIAIAGSHGKTSTTAMTTHAALAAGINAGFYVGSRLVATGESARLGAGELCIIETDESDRSFLNFSPSIAVITSISHEHVDTYHTLDDLLSTFASFTENIRLGGTLITCADDPLCAALPTPKGIHRMTYGFNAGADLQATMLEQTAVSSTFYVSYRQQRLGTVTLSLGGKHMATNCLASLLALYAAGIPFEQTIPAYATFAGVDRRFTKRGYFKDVLVVDDYGHHPREIASTLHVAHQAASGKLFLVFQPHRYTRTAGLWNEFIQLFNTLLRPQDELIITDIFPSSEQPIPGITAQALTAVLNEQSSATVRYVPFKELEEEVRTHLAEYGKPGDLILFQGAGKLNILAQQLGLSQS
jgi:UDP-N-acetylmuramate--alanine ligase